MASVLIDGSVLEGGGQILRNAVSLSALLNKPLVIQKIRYNRDPPGLKNQHRAGLQLAAAIASARLSGAKDNGSTSIEFLPGNIDLPGNFKADAITAGSITLLLQIALPLLLFTPSSTTPSTLTLLGGTNAAQAPQVEYTKHVFIPFIEQHFGVKNISVDVKKRGYFPKGGGEVMVTVTPFSARETLRCLNLLERGRVKSITGIAHYAKLPAIVGKGMIVGAVRQLTQAGYRPNTTEGFTDINATKQKEEVEINIDCRRESNGLSVAGGSGIVLWADLEGGGGIAGSAIGRKGVDPETVGEEAAKELIRGLESGGCVDGWLQDQIIIFMALADGISTVKCGKGGLGLHTKTAIWLAEKLTNAKFEIEEEPSGTILIRCQGVGYVANLKSQREEVAQATPADHADDQVAACRLRQAVV